MQDFVIETSGLTKQYGGITAVDALDLRVRRGEVYGFLGANGAGKTTTLRMLLGLIRPTHGHATVLGEIPGSAAGLRRTGSMIETPAFYPHLSGRQNLRVMARYSDIPAASVDAALAQVDLAGRGDDAFRTYSLGMKQRLGVAAALMKMPDLLILDEPTNGLDPAGMAGMRDLIRHLATAEGRTVLVSSHLMNEVEQICDRAGIIANGRLVAEGSIAELRGEEALVVQADPLDEAGAIIARLPDVRDVTVLRGKLRIYAHHDGALDPARINATLVHEGIEVRELRRDHASLESSFLTLTNGASSDATFTAPQQQPSHRGGLPAAMPEQEVA
jgi:ABC-type multidrug transport system ATPase subunit